MKTNPLTVLSPENDNSTGKELRRMWETTGLRPDVMGRIGKQIADEKADKLADALQPDKRAEIEAKRAELTRQEAELERVENERRGVINHYSALMGAVATKRERLAIAIRRVECWGNTDDARWHVMNKIGDPNYESDYSLGGLWKLFANIDISATVAREWPKMKAELQADIAKAEKEAAAYAKANGITGAVDLN